MFAETTLIVSRTRLTLNFLISSILIMTTRPLGIRITCDNDESLIEFAAPYHGIWCKEGGDLEKNCAKSHYHGLIHTSLTDNGLRKRLYNIFQTPADKKGQQTVAFSKITDAKGGEAGMIRYICKGTEKTLPLILQNNFSIDTTEQYDAYWDIYRGLQQEGKEKREKKQTNKANFKDYFVNTFISDNQDIGHTRLTPIKIAKVLFDYYKKNEWEMPSPTQGQTIINDLYLRYSGAPDNVLKRHYLEYWKIDYMIPDTRAACPEDECL